MAGGNVDGRDNVFGRHAIACRGNRLHTGNSGELDLVGVFALRNDDGVSVRKIVAPVRFDDGRAIRGDAICGQASGVSARIPRGLSWTVDELSDPRMGDESNDPDHWHDHGANDAGMASVHGIRELA